MISKKILKAINESVYRTLADLDDEEDISLSKSNIDFSRSEKAYNHYKFIDESFVDLGLPSGNLWCKFNLGATCKDNVDSWYGDYYAWGETEPKDIYNWANYKFSRNLTKYNLNDNLLELLGEDDPATKHLDKKTLVPSLNDWVELLKNTYITNIYNYKNINNLNGVIIASKVNKNHIFIPMAGYTYDDVICGKEHIGLLMSSTLNNRNHYYKCYSTFIAPNEFNINEPCNRSEGVAVRAIIKNKKD